MFRIYRVYDGIPTRNEDFLRGAETMLEATDWLHTYEDANGYAVAVYEVLDGGVDEVLAYATYTGPASFSPREPQHHNPTFRDCSVAEIQELLTGNPWKV